uniref:Uncharacterized protein n=1 Tax=Anguilla anguilla TaxID=7936 RepID=A0A0E9VTQ1_ANGAN
MTKLLTGLLCVFPDTTD